MSAGGRKIFLGGLTKTTTTDQLFDAFGEFGQVVDAVVMERNGHPRGFGFVTFKDKASVGKVIAAGVTIDGREVDLKRAVPEEEMVFCPSKVFVGGLSQSVDKSALKQHFEAFGEVRDAVVMMDRATSRSRGFGFVRFATAEGVEAALRTPHLLDGQWIDVKRAQPADALPPPKYPRTRAEEQQAQIQTKPMKAEKKREPRGLTTPKRSAAVAAPVVPQATDMAAQMAMWNYINLQQQQQMWAAMNAATATPFGFPPVPSVPPFNADINALLATISAPVAQKPKKDEEPVESTAKSSPFGDLSNVLESALASPAKSPSKSPTRPPTMSPVVVDAENVPGMVGNANPALPVVA